MPALAALLLLDNMTDLAEDLRIYWLASEGRKSPTVQYWLERLNYALRNGFDVDAFLADPVAALQEGRRWLGWKRGLEDGDHGYNNYVKLLNAIARYAGHDLRFKQLPEPRVETDVLSEAQIRRLFRFTSHFNETARRGRALIHFTLITGMRRSETMALSEGDLDPLASTVWVRKPAKGGLRRRLPVPRELWDPTKPFGLWRRLRPIPDDDRLAIWTTARSGKAQRMSVSTIGRTLVAIKRCTGVRFNFNIARHTVATRLLLAGYRPEYVQFYLGHSTFNTTRRYLRVREEDAHNAFRGLKLPRVGELWDVKQI